MLIVLLFALITLINCFGAQADSYSYYPNSPLYLGSNFDPATISSTKLPCIESTSTKQVHFSKGDVGTIENKFTLDQVTSRRMLYEYLNISASISGHYSFFSGSGSFELETENMFNSDSFTWIVRAYTNYGEFALENPRLNSEAKKLVRDKDYNSFIARCGTEYVGQVTKSVMVAAVYTISNLSVSAKNDWKLPFQHLHQRQPGVETLTQSTKVFTKAPRARAKYKSMSLRLAATV